MEMKKTMQFICITLQIFNGMLAFVTSQMQTRRIVKTIKANNLPQWILMGGGLVAAIVGTFIIFNQARKGIQQIDENNQILRSKLH